MSILCAIVIAVGIFMAGAAWGTRSSREDYEPLIESLLKLNERLVDRLKEKP